MDIASLLTTSFSLIGPYLKAGKEVLVDQLPATMKTIIPVVTKTMFDFVKGYFSKDKTAGKILEKAESDPSDSNLDSLKEIIKWALEDKEDQSFRTQIQQQIDELKQKTQKDDQELSRDLQGYSQQVSVSINNSKIKKSIMNFGNNNSSSISG